MWANLLVMLLVPAFFCGASVAAIWFIAEFVREVLDSV
jgi:hypothetical protein